MSILRNTLLLALLLGGCAGPQVPFKAYIGSERPLNEVAILRSNGSPDEIEVRFMEYGEGRTQFALANSGMAKEIRLLPGEYTVRLLCQDGDYSAKPYLFVQVSAGKSYEIACRRIGQDRLIRGSIKSIVDTPTTK